MNSPITELTKKVTAQAVQIPSMYGQVDFSITPERFADKPGDETDLEPEFAARRPELLANEEQVARIRAYTMHGDPVADAYAALIPQHGFGQLMKTLGEACDHGLEKVPSASPELVRFIQEMERFPAWLDMKLIEEGARIERNAYAHRAPFLIRSGFVATFMNKYSALPMALTGALSTKSAAHRVHETATFFTTTVMPGALDRYGAGFKAAAMVRLMHAMVRFNILHGRLHWDVKTYGIPIPQVDQMPAALSLIFPLARKALREGRTTFSRSERGQVELARYTCFLLGLPEELLPDTPQGLFDILLTRHATLRKGFDDTCDGLVRATMTADLMPEHSLSDRISSRLERGLSRVVFVRKFMRGNKKAAAQIGVEVSLVDRVSAAAAGILIAAAMASYTIAARIPVIRAAADRSLVRKLSRLLGSYGRAEFTTNADAYHPAHS